MTSLTRAVPPLTQAEQRTALGEPGELTIRLGTRASALATAQSTWVAEILREQGHQVELVPVRTEGDISRAPLTEIGGTGVFAAALRRALLEGRIDIAVHSLKDLPVAPLDGLVIGAVPPREDARDVLVSSGGRTLAELPVGAVVGTGSPRRAAQLHLIAPHLSVRDIRGNVDTRLRLVRDGELDAVVLAYAGLLRLGLQDQVSEVLDFDRMLPAPGQGALAVECRSGDAPADTALRAALALLDDPLTRAGVEAERQLLSRLEAGCTAPVGALGRLTPAEPTDSAAPIGAMGSVIELTGFAAFEGRTARQFVIGTDPAALAAELSAALLAEQPTDHPDQAAASLDAASPEPGHRTSAPPPGASQHSERDS